MRIIESGKTKQMADLNMVPLELQEALGAVIPEKDRETLQNMIAKGKSNWRIAAWLSARRGQIDTFQTVTGEWVDFRISPQGIEAENLDDWNSRYGISWEQAAAILGAQFNQKGGLCCVYPWSIRINR